MIAHRGWHQRNANPAYTRPARYCRLSAPPRRPWWLGLIAGIFEIGIGFWASQQLVPARAVLLIIWVGVFAIFRGITEIVLAFELKSLQQR